SLERQHLVLQLGAKTLQISSEAAQVVRIDNGLRHACRLSKRRPGGRTFSTPWWRAVAPTLIVNQFRPQMPLRSMADVPSRPPAELAHRSTRSAGLRPQKAGRKGIAIPAEIVRQPAPQAKPRLACGAI